MTQYKWPYPNEIGASQHLTCDVLVLGGGLAGTFAAIAAARKGQKVILMEKGTTAHAGSAGSGFDHWESACTNPGCLLTPKEVAEAYINEQDHYSNGIAHYIECREGWDRLLDIEQFGGKIRDTEDEFKGAAFRDDQTKLMYAYDYTNRYTLRIWGSGFKPALYKECLRLGVKILDRTEATALLTKTKGKKKIGVGACGMNVHTGRFITVSSKSTVLAMSRPARVWLFSSDLPGLCEFRPMNSIGSGHAMGFRSGVTFTMMEKSVRGEFSAAGRSFPPYSTGNNHNTWYGATMVDARGMEIPYLDRDGKVLENVDDRFRPAPGQKFFLKGGVIDNPKYEYRGPETMPFDELMKRGYKLPFYADLSRMPEDERRVIWGMMVGEEGRTKVPVLQYYTEKGFDPEKDMLQSYGNGWKSGDFLGQERQLFGAPGGIITDWDLMTSVNGVFAGGDQLFAMDCGGAASATGYYAGRKAADYAAEQAGTTAASLLDEQEFQRDTDLQKQCADEQRRLLAPMTGDGDMSWKELNFAISKCMQNYCGEIKCEDLLLQGLDLLHNYREDAVPQLHAENPHDLMRIHEVLDILDVSEMILEACRMRHSSSEPLHFKRSDFPEEDPQKDRAFITIHKEDGKAVRGEIPLDYYGDIEQSYESCNQDYIREAVKYYE
ncbi:MAG: FAD-binding protein [Eubacterium sp.]|jgi:succinate dehydrogenase/fumarate reductase flavoprotein subunit|uniref:FAD-dependent oxidoreductase n=1 Tax=Eubacterium sp. F2 TaxID=3381348 RepID=UPI003907EA3F|nr:FAD-binding protein [Eubacterium sp.]